MEEHGTPTEVQEPTTEIEVEDGFQFDEPENPSDQAPDAPPVDGEKKVIDQEVFNRAINKKVAKQKEAERKAEEAQRKLDEAEQRLAELTRKEIPDVPPIPDSFDDNFEAKIAERDRIIKEHAAIEAQKRIEQEEQQRQILNSQAAAQQAALEKVRSYQERVKNLKIDENQLAANESIVVQQITDPAISDFILEHEVGPQIVNYLGENPLELEKVGNMTAMQAAVYLSTNVSKEAIKTAPKKSNAPEPMETLGGRGTPEVEDPLIAGAGFE